MRMFMLMPATANLSSHFFFFFATLWGLIVTTQTKTKRPSDGHCKKIQPIVQNKNPTHQPWAKLLVTNLKETLWFL